MTKQEQALEIVKTKGTCQPTSFYCNECKFNRECDTGNTSAEDLVKIITKFLLEND